MYYLVIHYVLTQFILFTSPSQYLHSNFFPANFVTHNNLSQIQKNNMIASPNSLLIRSVKMSIFEFKIHIFFPTVYLIRYFKADL